MLLHILAFPLGKSNINPVFWSSSDVAKPAIKYEFQRGDYVLINNQTATDLTPTYMGPFLLVSLTDNGNATVHTDDNASQPAQRWSVRRERLVPYRYEYRCYDAVTHGTTTAIAGM